MWYYFKGLSDSTEEMTYKEVKLYIDWLIKQWEAEKDSK